MGQRAMISVFVSTSSTNFIGAFVHVSHSCSLHSFVIRGVWFSACEVAAPILLNRIRFWLPCLLLQYWTRSRLVNISPTVTIETSMGRFSLVLQFVFLPSRLWTPFSLSDIVHLDWCDTAINERLVGLYIYVATHNHVDVRGDALSSFRWQTSSFNQFSYVAMGIVFMEKVSLVHCHNIFRYMPLTFVNFIDSFIITQLEQLAARGILMLDILPVVV